MFCISVRIKIIIKMSSRCAQVEREMRSQCSEGSVRTTVSGLVFLPFGSGAPCIDSVHVLFSSACLRNEARQAGPRHFPKRVSSTYEKYQVPQTECKYARSGCMITTTISVSNSFCPPPYLCNSWVIPRHQPVAGVTIPPPPSVASDWLSSWCARSGTC